MRASIAMSRYIVANRLRNNLFRLALFRKLLIPIPDFATNPAARDLTNSATTRSSPASKTARESAQPDPR